MIHPNWPIVMYSHIVCSVSNVQVRHKFCFSNFFFDYRETLPVHTAFVHSWILIFLENISQLGQMSKIDSADVLRQIKWNVCLEISKCSRQVLSCTDFKPSPRAIIFLPLNISNFSLCWNRFLRPTQTSHINTVIIRRKTLIQVSFGSPAMLFKLIYSPGCSTQITSMKYQLTRENTYHS